MKAYGDSGGLAPLILNLDIRWKSAVSLTPQALYHSGRSLWYSLSRRLGGPQTCSGHSIKQKIFMSLLGSEK